jgi:phosphoglycolate phosphatase
MATVIFDLDGTLFCSHLCIMTAVKHTLKTLGLPPVTDDLIMSLIGEKYAVFASKIAPGFNDEDLLWKIYTQSERDTIRHEAQLFDGIHQLLVMLKQEGHKLAVCSNGSMEYIELALNSTGIYDLFDLLVTGNAFRSKSEAAAHILSKLPNDCAVFVGDRFHDFQAAADNNLPSIGAAYGYCPDNELNLCTYTAYSAADVHAFINQIAVFAGICSDIASRPAVRVIGVNGVDTSGKTVFSENLCKYLNAKGKNAALLHMDDFHNPASIRKIRH